jgi:hypothetical protein
MARERLQVSSPEGFPAQTCTHSNTVIIAIEI